MKSLCIVVLVVLPAIVLATSNVKNVGRPANLGYGTQQTGLNQGGGFQQTRPGGQAVNAGYGTQGQRNTGIQGSNTGYGSQGPVRTPGFQGSNTGGYGANQGPVRNAGFQGSNPGRAQTLPGNLGHGPGGFVDPIRPVGSGFGGQATQGGYGGRNQGGFGGQGQVIPQTKPLRPDGPGYGRQQALPAQTNYKG